MSKEHAYAYEAGYRDGSINYELEHCPACKNVADLQEALAENAKLRELVRKVLQFERAGCEGCPYASTCDVDCLYEPNCPMREDIERDMRELEVDACPNCGAKVVEPTKNDVDVEVEQ